MPNNLTDAEIKKALECCAKNASCTDCPLRETKSNCGDYFLDLFNRQEQENESLKAEVERWRNECGHQSTLWSKHFESIFETAKETIKAEAYKEFAEKLKEKKRKMLDYDEAGFSSKITVVSIEKIDNLLNELVGDTSAEKNK